MPTERPNRLDKLDATINEIKGLVHQVKEALTGNPLSNDDGIVGRLTRLEKKIEFYERLRWVALGIAAGTGFTIRELVLRFLNH